MEKSPEGYLMSFYAAKDRENIVRKMVLEFAGVELVVTPTSTPNDFQKHMYLTFPSAEQMEDFRSRMLHLGLQIVKQQDATNPH